MTTARSTLSAPPVPAVFRPHLPLGIVVAIACVAQFMVVLDTAIVNVALPAMRADLGLSTSQQQWVVDAYLLTFGGLLLLAARAGDLFGRRTVLQAGLVVFTVASLVGGLAENGTMLLAARAAQGIGAAALAPASLSLITVTHPEGHQRSRALGIWGAAASAAAAVGVVLGGVLTDLLNWRWVLFVNVPVGIALIVAVAVSLLPSARPEGRRVPLDLPGAFTVTAGIGALVYGISQATEQGWSSAAVITALVAAVALLAGFLLIEARTADPLVRLSIFRLRKLSTANLVMLCLGATMTATLFFLSLYLQQLLGYSALRAGLAMLPMSAVLGGGALLSRRLVVAGIRHLPVYGMVVATAGLLWLTRLPADPAYLAHVLLPTLVVGAGFSISILPVTLAATAGVPHQDAGLASGLLSVSRQIGGALGLAVLVTVSASATTTQLQAHHSQADATLHGYHLALLIAAGISLLAALFAWTSSAPRRAAA
ncbi:MFS transporter [Streptacidiphilus sp. PAMC 29251]